MKIMLSADIREETGKGVARRLRLQGRVPAILYGKENISISLDARETQKILSNYGVNRLLQLQMKKGKKSTEYPVLIKEVQVNPVRGDLLHLDLFEVSLDHKINISIPVVLIGQEERPDDGLLVEQQAFEVEISCLPTQIPEKIEVDVSGLALNKPIIVGDLTPPEGVEFITPMDETLVVASVPRLEVEEEAEEEETEAAEGEGATEEGAPEGKEE